MPMTDRISIDDMMMRIAEVVSERGTCSRLQVGAVVAAGPYVLSVGYNGAARSEPHCDHTGDRRDQPCETSLHAESNAIDFLHGVSSDKLTMYVTHAPCMKCAGRVINYGIHRVVFKNHFRSNLGEIRLQRAGVEIKRYGVVEEGSQVRAADVDLDKS